MDKTYRTDINYNEGRATSHGVISKFIGIEYNGCIAEEMENDKWTIKNKEKEVLFEVVAKSSREVQNAIDDYFVQNAKEAFLLHREEWEEEESELSHCEFTTTRVKALDKERYVIPGKNTIEYIHRGYDFLFDCNKISEEQIEAFTQMIEGYYEEIRSRELEIIELHQKKDEQIKKFRERYKECEVK